MAGGAVMNMLMPWSVRIADYLTHRRQTGFALANDAGRLVDFARFMEQGDHPVLTSELAIRWARSSKRQSPITWARRIEVLRGFAHYWQQFDTNTEIPPRACFGSCHRRLVPHIFTPEELTALLKSCGQLLPIDGLRPITCRTILGLLAATGLRISEAIHLKRDNVDLREGVLSIREAKFHHSRIVPLHPSTTRALHDYALLRDGKVPTQTGDAPFFLQDNGSGATAGGIRYALQSLCKMLNWQPRGDHERHRLHDLRHTFIVHSTLRCYQNGGAPDREMQALSTYVGHVHVSDTYWYLTGIPELMAIAAERFQGFVNHQEDGK